jgi:hypothetical protein
LRFTFGRDNAIADKGYDAEHLIGTVTETGAEVDSNSPLGPPHSTLNLRPHEVVHAFEPDRIPANSHKSFRNSVKRKRMSQMIEDGLAITIAVKHLLGFLRQEGVLPPAKWERMLEGITREREAIPALKGEPLNDAKRTLSDPLGSLDDNPCGGVKPAVPTFHQRRTTTRGIPGCIFQLQLRLARS